jgi:hypothetical protein
MDCDNPDCCPPEFCARCGIRREMHDSMDHCAEYVSLDDVVRDAFLSLSAAVGYTNEHDFIKGYLAALVDLAQKLLDDLTTPDDDPVAGSWLATLARVEAEAAGRPFPRSAS